MRTSIAVALSSTMIATAAASDMPALMPVKEAVHVIADGKPWTGTRPGRETIRITINADETFVFDGPLTIEGDWFLREQELCLKMGMILGDKCLRFSPIFGGFQAYENGKEVFTLTRP